MSLPITRKLSFFTKPQRRGFTLIELLIVVTLIGILSVAVLSAINPIEQVNKARDAGRRADANQTLAAIERYYAAVQEFPWNNAGFGTRITSVSGGFLGRVDMLGVGICGAELDGTESVVDPGWDAGGGGCKQNSNSQYGLLVTTEELKSQFAKRRAFRSGHPIEDEMFIIKPDNDPSISVCFVPSSKATRNTWSDATKGLKFITVAADPNSADHYLPSNDGIGTCVGQFGAIAPTWDTTDPAQWCFVCIPEE